MFILDLQLRARGVIKTGYIQVNLQRKNFFTFRNNKYSGQPKTLSMKVKLVSNLLQHWKA